MSRKCAAGGSVVVVVSPLISLMEDQVASLRKHHKWEGANDVCVVTEVTMAALTPVSVFRLRIIKRMRKQWNLLPFSGLGTRLMCGYLTLGVRTPKNVCFNRNSAHLPTLM